MPELPEVENVARTLRPGLVGRLILSVRTSGLPLRRPVDATRLADACRDATVTSVDRYGKYLLIALSSGATLVSHLGMSGRLLFASDEAPEARHTHIVFQLDDHRQLRYVDPRRFGVVSVYPAAEVRSGAELSVLGVDPLSPAFTKDYLFAAMQSTRRDLKAFLLDQGQIAGLGNIYASEALFYAALSPRRKANRVSRTASDALHRAVAKVLRDGVRNGGTSFSDYVDANGNFGDNQNRLAVYGRKGEPCRRCGRAVRRLVQSARSTFYCSNCQK